MTYRIVQNKDTCPRSRLKRRRENGGGKIKAAGERVYSVHVVIVMGRVAMHKPRGGRNYFHKFRAALCGPPFARALTRAGARSVVDEFSLRATNLPLQKNVSIQEARLIQTPVFYRGWKRRIICFCAAYRSSGTRRGVLHRTKVDFNNFYREP